MKKPIGLLKYSWLTLVLSLFLALSMIVTGLPHELIAQSLLKEPADNTTATASGPADSLQGGESDLTQPPEVTTNIVVEDISSDAAVLKGELTSLGSADTVKVYFEYGESEEPGMLSENLEMNAAGVFQIRLEGLNPATTYYFRAVAETLSGVFSGPLVSFTTIEELPVENTNDDISSTDNETPDNKPAADNNTTEAGSSLIFNSILITPQVVESGHETCIEVSVTNTSAKKLEYKVILEVDGKPEDAQNIDLAGSDTQTISFNLVKSEPGQYSLSVGTLSRILTVVDAEDPLFSSSVGNITRGQAKPDEEASLKTENNRIRLDIPAGAVDEPLDIEIHERDYADFSKPNMIELFDLNAYQTSDQKLVSQFNRELKVTLTFNEFDLAGWDTDTLRLYCFDETSEQWIKINSSRFNPENLTLTADLNHFSTYSAEATLLQAAPGRIMASLVDLHSGAATYSYPLELPPGPGGFQPKITLNYTSASVDEIKNPKVVGSWVGIGWSLSLGCISYDLSGREYYLELNGASYKLITSNSMDYHTNPESHYKITRSGNTWSMLDCDGYSYRFGGNTNNDSKRYLYNSTYYRWDLDLISDTNGNQAAISYIQDIRESAWVRSAYPTSLTYNNGQVVVSFVSSAPVSTTDGYMRADNPISYGDNPAPKIMDTRQLDSVSITVNGNLLRRYNFAYATTACGYSGDDDDRDYYAGDHTLTSITQIGADGSSALPSTSFTYYDELSISGFGFNITKPRLESISSGYGGTVSYEYAGKSATDAWSRQCIESRTVDPGSDGTDIVYTYSYTGSPQYSGKYFNQKYVGFNEVVETSGGYSTFHYFYTTGTVNNHDADKLTGREYLTKWYDSDDNLVKQVDYDWEWEYCGTQTSEGTYLNSYSNGTLSNPYGLAVSQDGYVYVCSTGTNRIVKYDANLTYIASPFDNIAITSPQCIAIGSQNNIFVTCGDGYVRAFNNSGTSLLSFDTGYTDVCGLALAGDYYCDGSIYVTLPSISKVYKYDMTGSREDQAFFDNTYYYPYAVALSPDGNYLYCLSQRTYAYLTIYTTFFYSTFYTSTLSYSDEFNDDYLIDSSILYCPYGIAANTEKIIFTNTRTNSIDVWSGDSHYALFSVNSPKGVAIGENNLYVVANGDLRRYTRGYANWRVKLDQVDETTGAKTASIHYVYDNYGNIITEYRNGDISDSNDDSTLWRQFGYNISLNILNKPIRERTYSGLITSDNGGTGLTRESNYYYDGSYNPTTGSFSGDDNQTPTKGNLTRNVQMTGSGSVTSYIGYDSYGNKVAEKDPNGNLTKWTYNTAYQPYYTYPASKTYPPVEAGTFTEGYIYDPGTSNLLSQIDVNNQTTTYTYDTFKRLTQVFKPGDTSGSLSTMGLESGSTVTTISNNRITLNRFFNTSAGKLVSLELKMEDTTPTGSVRLGIYSDNNGAVGSLLLDAGEAPVNNGWVSISGSNFTLAVNTYYWLAFNLSASNIVEYKTNYGTGTRAYATCTYGVLPSTVNSPTYNANACVMRAVIATGTPSAIYQYCNWGTLNSQNITTISRTDSTHVLWQKEYFDGLGRIIQTHHNGESGATIISDTTAYDSRGLVSKKYVTQKIDSILNAYYTPLSTWKYTACVYDELERLTGQTNPDDTTLSNDYSTAWRTIATNQRGAKTAYTYDAFGRLTRVQNQSSTLCDRWYIPSSYDTSTITSPENVYLSDNVYASSSTAGTYAVYSNFNIPNIPGDATINGIEVSAEVYGSRYNVLYVYLSYNGGTNYTSTKTTGNISSTEKTYLLGGSTNTWNRTWSANEFTNTNFKIKAHWQYGYAMYLDCLKVKVYYTTGAPTSTTYAYDVLGNLTSVTDDDGNVTSIDFDWLSRKTSMNDPDMGYWEYAYYANGNLHTQTDSKNQTITMDYDALNRLTGKTCSTGMTADNYTYDIGTYAKGHRTAMTDGSGSTAYTYDARGRLTQEVKTISGVAYTTGYGYDQADRLISTAYPGGEVVSQSYNGRGLPYSLSGSATLVNSTVYNTLGGMTSMTLGSGATTTYGYYGAGGANDTTGGFYGRLWEIKTVNASSAVLQDNKYDWDANGNLSTRQTWLNDTSAWDTLEYFGYDDLDRLTSAAGPYTESYSYDTIGNITSKNATAYAYGQSGAGPHAATTVGSNSYTYDANGNMLTGDGREIVWDAENRPAAIVKDGIITNYSYDGDGSRVSSSTLPLNGSFEEGSPPYGWNANGVTLSSDSSTVKIGSKSIKLVSTGYYQTAYQLLNSNNIAILRGRTVTFGAWVWCGSGGTAAISIEDDNQCRTSFHSGGSQWQWLSLTQTIDSETNYLCLAFVMYSAATAYFDGAALVIGSTITPTTADDTINNVYINRFYQKNTFTGVATTSYYLGNKLIAVRKGATLSYIHQDSLGSSSVTSTSSGAFESRISYLPFGSTHSTSGTLPTDKKFTGQRLDANTGLYYYNARYYDPQIGRFISPDTIVQDYSQPQILNRYSYCLNNPLKYTDPSGHVVPLIIVAALLAANVLAVAYDIIQYNCNPSMENAIYAMADAVDPIPAPTRVWTSGLSKAVNWISKLGKGEKVVEGAKSASNITDDAIDTVEKGKNVVYISKNADGTVKYVGISNDLARRAAEQLRTKGIDIEPLMEDLNRGDARAVEQALIEIYGLEKNGGTLINKINSIAESNPEYAKQLQRGFELLQSIGYKV